MRSAVAIVAAALAFACGSAEPPPHERKAAAPAQELAARAGRPCPQEVELTERDVGCRCGIEELIPRQLADLPAARAIEPDAMWRCNQANQLALTIHRREVP